MIRWKANTELWLRLRRLPCVELTTGRQLKASFLLFVSHSVTREKQIKRAIESVDRLILARDSFWRTWILSTTNRGSCTKLDFTNSSKLQLQDQSSNLLNQWWRKRSQLHKTKHCKKDTRSYFHLVWVSRELMLCLVISDTDSKIIILFKLQLPINLTDFNYHFNFGFRDHSETIFHFFLHLHS